MSTTRQLCTSFLEDHPIDAIRVLEHLSADVLGPYLARLRPVAAATVLEHAAPSMSAACMVHMSPRAASKIVTRLHPDFRIAVLRQLAPKLQKQVIREFAPDVAEQSRRLLRYPEGTIGNLLEPFALTVSEDISAAQALKRVKKTKQRVRFYVFVVDRDFKLTGVVSLHELMRAAGDSPVSSIMIREVVRLQVGMAHEDMVKSPYWRQFNALPVVDEDGMFLGLIRHQTLAWVRDELKQAADQNDAMDTVLALGELYWLGLAGVMDGIAATGAEEAEGKDNGN